jgi:hypothetical protein
MQLQISQVLVSLRSSADQPEGFLEVVDIRGAEEPNPTIPIAGLPGISILQISSWFQESEIDAIRSQNPQILFDIGGF